MPFLLFPSRYPLVTIPTPVSPRAAGLSVGRSVGTSRGSCGPTPEGTVSGTAEGSAEAVLRMADWLRSSFHWCELGAGPELLGAGDTPLTAFDAPPPV